MNLSPELPLTVATGMTLFAAFLWGSWFISLKHIGNYPIDAFLLTALTFSFVFVWAVGVLLDQGALFANIGDTFRADASRVWVTLVCGVGYVMGLRLSLQVMHMLGLSLAQPLQSSVNLFGGTSISIFIGGLPAGASALRIFVAAAILFSAVMMGLVAGRLRVHSTLGNAAPGMPTTMRDLWRGLGLAVIASTFIPAYTLALAYGLRSTTQPNGLAVLPFMAMLVTGAAIGSWLSSGVVLTVKRQWHCIWEAGFRVHRWGLMSGLFHYGGNIIHTFGTAQISAAIAWPLGMTAGLWVQFWGLVHGEMRGAPRSAYAALAIAVALYIWGAHLVASVLYF